MGETSNCLRKRLEEREERLLARHAARSSDTRLTHRQYPQDPDDLRTEFYRDYTRIIHSRAFRRLRHKTQVFISPRNDHLCTRMEHSIHVHSVATTIARGLNLNEDLAGAIAMAHDVGHAPFGHLGERALHSLAANQGMSFQHELHSLRVVDFVESPYPDHHGLNLTFAVRDGIACHHGEGFERSLEPDRTKAVDSLQSMQRGAASPGTLEGCVVRWADKVAYLGRDLEDAVALGMVQRAELPGAIRRVLGSTNKEIIGSLTRELVAHSAGSDAILVGEEMHEALNELYKFNMARIYQSKQATRHNAQIERAMIALFDFLVARLQEAKGDLERVGSKDQLCLQVFAEFLRDDIRAWPEERPARLILDFIAGMTDSFFIDSFEELFLPRSSI